MTMNDFAIRQGFSEAQRSDAAALYMDAFGAKLGSVLGRGDRAQAFVAEILQPEFAISAVDADLKLLGVAGFKTRKGAFVGGELKDLQRHYGWFGGLWRGLTLSVLDREVEEGSLLMDGICVTEAARGRGVGSALLDAIAQEASRRGLRDVRLDVIDKNPRAKALYARKGFEEGETSHLGPLKYLFGFKSATTMRLTLTAVQDA